MNPYEEKPEDAQLRDYCPRTRRHKLKFAQYLDEFS
jgi:hypothetical protein